MRRRTTPLGTSRALFSVAIFGGIYFVVVTAAEVMGFGTSATGLKAFGASPSLLATSARLTSDPGWATSSRWGRRSAPSRNVYPYPPKSSDAYWYAIVAGGWLVAAIIAVLVAPRTARKLGTALATREGITTD